MPETAKERRERLMGGGATAPAAEETTQQRRARLMGQAAPVRATPEVAAVARAAIYGDVADESVTPADEADKIALLDRVGTRRMATTRDFPIEAFGTTRGPQEMASKQAEFDVPAVADLERQAGPIKTKADVRRIGDAADMARAEAQYRVEHPTHPKMPDQYRDPAESRRFLSEAPGRREARAEYEASGTRSPFLALAGSRMAKAASFGFVNPEDPESVISTPQERKILAGQDEFATPMERLGVGVATTAGMLLPVARIGGMFASGFKAAGASDAVASTVGNLLAGSVHGGVTERSAEAAVESGLYMGGQMGLARVMRGAAPTAGRFLTAEGGAGVTASAIAQLAANGVADPVQVIADGLTNALFGVGQARAAGRARTEAMVRVRERVAAEIRAGKELRVVMAQMRDDADVQAMLRTPDEGATGDMDAMLAETGVDPRTTARLEGEAEALAPASRPAPENRPGEGLEMLADQEPTSTESRVSVAPVRFPKPPKPSDKPTYRWTGTTFEEVPPVKAKYPSESKRYNPEESVTRLADDPPPVDAPAPAADTPTVKGGYRWDGENFVVDRGTPEPVAIPKQPKPAKPKKGDTPLPPRDAPLPGTEAERMLAEPATRDVAPATPDVAVRPVPAPETPPSRPGKVGERGVVDVSGAGKRAAIVARKLLGRESQKIRDLDTPSARAVADAMERSADTAGREEGPITGPRRNVERAVIRHPSAAMRIVSGDRVKGQDYSLWKADEVLAGRAEAGSPEESQIIQALDDYSQARGRGFENVGTRRLDPKTGDPIPFKAPPKILPRVFHAEGQDIMLRGPKDRAWTTLVKAIAHANEMPVEAVDKILLKRRNQIIGLEGVSGPDLGRKSEAEVFREFKRMPSDIWVRGRTGIEQRIRILETDPVLYARRGMQTGTSRMGVIDAFGQDVGEEAPLNNLRKKFIEENTAPGFDATKAWERIMRLTHSIPVKDRLIPASHPLAPIARGVGAVYGVIKEGMMSLRAAVNIPENLGAPREFIGDIETGKLMLESVTNLFKTKEGRAARKAELDYLESIGVITDEGFTAHPDPSRPASSAAMMARQIISTITGGRPIEGKQERDMGRGAKRRADTMKGRTGEGRTYTGERDVQRVLSLGYDDPTARRLAYGEGTQAEYETMMRSAQKKILGANVKGVDLSPLEHSRLGSAMWYSRWSHMNLRQGARTLMAAGKGIERAFNEPGISAKDRALRAGASVGQILSWVTGRVVSNSMGTAIASFVTGGPLGFKTNMNEAGNDLDGYLTRSFLYGVLGGPYGAIIRNMGQNLSEQGKGVFTPVMVTEEIYKAIAGEGRYMDLSPSERIGAIGNRFLPVLKVFTTGAMSGGGDRARESVAERAFWRYMNDKDGTGKREFAQKPDPYRAEVKRMIDAVEKGDMEKARAAYADARKAFKPGQDPISKHVTRRLFLTGDGPEERAKLAKLLPGLRAQIGDEAYAELAKRDRRLLDFLNSVGGK